CVGGGVSWGALGFRAVLRLLWAGLRCGGRAPATAVLILSGFTAWGTLAGGGPFAGATLDDAFVPLIAFMLSISVVSLALSAHVATRKRIETKLRQHEHIL